MDRRVGEYVCFATACLLTKTAVVLLIHSLRAARYCHEVAPSALTLRKVANRLNCAMPMHVRCPLLLVVCGLLCSMNLAEETLLEASHLWPDFDFCGPACVTLPNLCANLDYSAEGMTHLCDPRHVGQYIREPLIRKQLGPKQ